MSPDALTAALADVVAKGDFQVPPYPAVALRLQRILARQNYGLGEVADTIAADPALAARILGVVNSALYRAAEDITSLPRAVNRLGARVVSALAVAAGIGSNATQAGSLFDVKYRAWRRSVTCALACQKLARLRNVDENAAFLAGLIHGFGRSVAVAALERLLATQRPAAPLELLQWLQVAEAQRERLALAVAERWQLPEEIMEALRPGVKTPMAALVAEGERIAEALESSWRPEGSSAAETRAIDELIQGLPAALDALAAVPPPAPARASVIATPEKALTGERRRCSVPLADCRKKGAAKLTGVSLAPTGVEASSSAPLQEGSIVRLAAGDDAARIESWFNVVLCAPNGSAWRVEAELFSPPREIREAWQALFERAAPV
ncbi:MAG TPA: HDOD domain-containing protein [Polyangiaceae bacterium]|nr:HDOD domain-containing protein [Polyangiaceae bacterium]